MIVPIRARTITAEAWRQRRGERGQIMPLLALTIVTMGVMAMIAITFGQAVVRRQQAQMVVDAAAFAGAAEQAKGLNTLARINEKQYNALNSIIAAQATGMATGYHDSWSTTMRRLSILCIVPFCAGPDWSSRNWFDYREQVFGTLNRSAEAVNTAYGAALKPNLAARKIVNDNFGPSNAIFQNESPVRHGPVVYLTESDALAKLVRLTPTRRYPVGNARHYQPHPGALLKYCRDKCQYLLIPKLIAACTVACVEAGYAKYITINVHFNTIGMAQTGAPRYSAGHFYDNQIGRDVRFSYYLRVAGPQPLFGKSWFLTAPDMVVVATAKPYGGHLGNYYEERWPALGNNWVRFGYTQDPARLISPTYKARLIPVRTLEKRQLMMMEAPDALLDPELLGRYMSVMH